MAPLDHEALETGCPFLSFMFFFPSACENRTLSPGCRRARCGLPGLVADPMTTSYHYVHGEPRSNRRQSARPVFSMDACVRTRAYECIRSTSCPRRGGSRYHGVARRCPTVLLLESNRCRGAVQENPIGGRLCSNSNNVDRWREENKNTKEKEATRRESRTMRAARGGAANRQTSSSSSSVLPPPAGNGNSRRNKHA
ncbi:hypothetical protein MRX96_036103 [Rhipicephalus microplus]